MRKIICLLCCLCLMLGLVPSASAASNEMVLCRSAHEIENGITVINEIIAYPQNHSGVTEYTNRQTFQQGSSTIAVISIWGEFRYDGRTASVISKEVTQADTYDGWNYSQTSFTSSGGTITLKGKLSKTFVAGTSFTMTLSCDKDGNISYT